MKNEQPEAAKPVAYDAEGRPLYHRPPAAQPPRRPNSMVSSKPTSQDGHNFNPQIRTQYANEPKFIHAVRQVEPSVSELSEEVQRRHKESVERYPFLNLSEGEYVILQIKRHPIGLLTPIIAAGFAVVVLVALAFLVPDFYASTAQSSTLPAGVESTTEKLVIAILLLLALLAVMIGGAAVWVYQRNQFFMTNESVIQEIQHSLFSHHEQTVSLGSIEDASFRRQGVLQHLFNYGTMRLSTEGEETTYRFSFVENPKEQIAIVSNAVEAFKNGRPVSG